MPFFLRKLLPEKDFQENFNNTVAPQKTLALFSFKKENNCLWHIWGYGYNKPGKMHAEVLILNEIEGYIPENQTEEKYKMKWFISYTPCHQCSARIKSFLALRNGISMEIKASRPYFFTHDKEREGLHLLKRIGVSIKMMDKFDYKECLYLFVHPTKKFTSWPHLDDQSQENADNLDKLWKQPQTCFLCLNQEEKKAEENMRKIIKIPNHNKMMDSSNTSVGVQDVFKTDLLLDGHCQSPVMKERTQLSGTETPQKLQRSAKITETGKGVKRKLDFFDD